MAYLCKLLDRNMNLLQLVRQQDSNACKERLVSFESRVKKALVYGDEDDELGSLGSSLGSARESAGKRPQSHHHHLHQAKKQKSKLRQLLPGDKRPPTPPPTTPNEMDMPRFALIADGRSLHYAMKHAKQELE